MDLYAENILDHYRHPRCKGAMPGASVSWSEANVACGDECTLHLHMEEGRITEARWEGTGCAISQAGISMLCEEIEGMDASEAGALRRKDIEDLLGVPVGPRRFKCALLCLHTLKNALRSARSEPPQGWLETVEIDEE